MAEDKNLNNRKLIGAIEALLFVYGEPLTTGKIAKIISKKGDFGKIKEEEIKESLSLLNEALSKGSRGLKLILQNDEVQLATQPEFSALLEDFIKEEFKENLSPASLETLSLISYLGPMSRSQIDFYRGVNSSFILRSLLIRGLISRFPDPKRQNVYLYQPSFDLLKYLGISSVTELPEYQKFKQMEEKTSAEEKAAPRENPAAEKTN